MRVMCEVLPAGRRVRVEVATRCARDVCAALQRRLRLRSSTVTLLARTASGADSSALAPVDDELPTTTTHVCALLRCRAGGKGGFRKQLEKKAREFARAKRTRQQQAAKQKQRHESAAAAASTTAAVTKRAATTTTGDSSDVDMQLLRTLAQQGVDRVVAQARRA